MTASRRCVSQRLNAPYTKPSSLHPLLCGTTPGRPSPPGGHRMARGLLTVLLVAFVPPPRAPPRLKWRRGRALPSPAQQPPPAAEPPRDDPPGGWGGAAPAPRLAVPRRWDVTAVDPA